MFYNMFLDRGVARALEGYDALAVLEWDILVAHSESFDRLYKAAFFSTEEFWMKGSTLAGREFHATAGVSEMWHVLGHLNGNAICESWCCRSLAEVLVSHGQEGVFSRALSKSYRCVMHTKNTGRQESEQPEFQPVVELFFERQDIFYIAEEVREIKCPSSSKLLPTMSDSSVFFLGQACRYQMQTIWDVVVHSEAHRPT